MKKYKLLTPGPLTTTDTVKKRNALSQSGMMIIKRLHRISEKDFFVWHMPAKKTIRLS